MFNGRGDEVCLVPWELAQNPEKSELSASVAPLVKTISAGRHPIPWATSIRA
jgi:hypothetical protein